MAGGGGAGGNAGAIEAGKAVVRLSADGAGLRSSLDKARRMVLGFGKSLARVGGVMFGASIVPLAAAFAKSMSSLTDISKMENAARAMGMTSEAASGLFGMLAQNGGEFKEDLEGLTQFAQRVQDAIHGVGGATGEAAKLFNGLSVQAKDLEGLPIDEMFYRIHAAIRELPQDLQMTKLALIGGTDSMKKWLPLLSRSTAELRAQAKASSMSSDDMNSARESVLAYQRATLAMTQAWRQVAVALAPTITLIAEKVVPAFNMMAKFIGKNKQLITSLAAGAGIVAGVGAALIGLGTALAVATFAVGGLMSAVSAVGAVLAAVFSPVGLGIAAIAVAGVMLVALAAETETFWNLLDTFGGAFKMIWGEIASVFQQTWRGISDALSAGDMKLAFQVGLAGLNVLWKEFVLMLTIGWNKFKSDFVDGWHLVMTTVEIMLYRMLATFQREMRGIWDRVPTRIKTLMAAMGSPMDALMGANIKSEEEIIAAAAKAQADRDAARAADQLAAAMDVAKAKLELNDKQAEAFRARWARPMGDLAMMMIGLGRGAHRKMAEATAGMSELGSSRGGFGGQNAALRFGVGEVQQKQLEELKDINDQLGEIKNQIGGIPID